jgi:hypothetical protein
VHRLLARLSLIGLLPALLAYAGEAQVYRFRDSTSAPAGSNISRPATFSSTIPFDRIYTELTAEQQALVRDQYKNMADQEEPPRPKRGLRALFQELNRNLYNVKGRIESAQVVAVARVDEQGEVKQVHMYKTPDADVTSAVSAALFRTEFKPALNNGKPVAMDFLLDFTLDR